MIKTMLLVGVGGFFGTCGRFAMYKLCDIFWHGAYPLGTFTVNIIGCLLFGLFSGIFEKSNMLSPTQSAMLITGFCGGFTTFSTFAGDICNLGTKCEWGISAAYLALSVILGIAMVWVGRAIAQSIRFS